MLGARELLGRRERDQPALVEEADARGERERLADVVGDEDDGLAQPPRERRELALQLQPRDRVERAEGLVHKHDRRVGGERPRHPDPLPLPARELARVAVAVDRGVEPDQLEQFVDAGADARLLPALEARHERDVARNRHVGEEADLLEHVADVPPQPDRVPVSGRVPLDADRARARREQPVDHLERRRLARPAAAHEHQRLARLDGEREFVEHQRAARRAVGDPVEFDGRRHAAALRPRPGRGGGGRTVPGSHARVRPESGASPSRPPSAA